MLNIYIKSLNSSLENGSITESMYAKQLKNYYDVQGELLDHTSLNFVESKLNELNVPLSNVKSTDGVIKQAVSGLIEGFTTLGFADKPDTPMEKIVNNVSHLIGLAPGIMLGGGRMLVSASKTVGNALIRRGALEKNKSLVKMGKALEAKSEVYSKSNSRAQKFLGKMADKMRYVSKDGKIDLNLRSSTPTALDPRTSRSIYDLKSIPGKISEVVQNNALAFMGENKATGLNFITKGLLRGQFSEEAVGRILHEAGHVGLLMAFSNHPLAMRNEGGLSADGVKAMAFAGMHGALAGGIFGSIGQYANISKLMTSTNPAMVKTGENLIRKTAKALATKKTADSEQFINTIARGTAGAGYGGITASINDLPVEEQIYETLMGVFFSVNARPTWEAKATKDINTYSNMFNRLHSTDKQKELLRSQDWFVRESKDYQRYWENHFDTIREQQLTSREHVSELLSQRILKVARDLEKDGKLDQSEINAALEGKSTKEGSLNLLSTLVEFRNNLRDPNYNMNIEIDPYKPNEFVDMSWLTQSSNWRDTQTRSNMADFPSHSLTEVFKRVNTQYGERVGKQQFVGDVTSIYNRLIKNKRYYTIDPRTERRVINVDKFVQEIQKKYKEYDWKSDQNGTNEARRIALRFDFLREAKKDYVIDFTDGAPKTRKVGKPSPTPKEDPQKNSVSKLTAGNRDSFEGFNYMNLQTISYMRVYDNATGKKIWVSPLSRQVWINDKGQLQSTPYVKEKQWIEFEKEQLNKNRKFVYGGISDTGRLDVRTYPWKGPPAKGKKESPYHWNATAINNIHAAIYREIRRTQEGRDWYNNLSEEVKNMNKNTKANTIATMIYRMRELGLITKQTELHSKNLKSIIAKIPSYFKAEKAAGGYGNESKSQKYLKLMDVSDITFLEGKKLGLKDEKMKGIILEDLNAGKLNDSETDGTIILDAVIFDKLVKYMGGDNGTGMGKGSLYSPPKDGNSLMIGKYAYARADRADMAYMKNEGLQYIIYTSSAKHFGNRPVNYLNDKNYDPKKATIDQNVYPEKPETVELETKDFTWSIDIREKINVTGKLNMMQQMFLNANGVQFDKDTPVGKNFYDAWETLLTENVKGNSKVNKAAEKALKAKKRKNESKKAFEKRQSWDNLNIDEISIDLIDSVVSSRTKHPAFKSILKHLYYESKHNITLDLEKSIQEQQNEKHVGQHLQDGGFSLPALMERGNSKFVETTLRNYIISRIVRPQVQNSYSSILAPYDWKYSLKKQKYSEADKGLADNEFMLWSGAEGRMYVKNPETGRNMKLGDWWKKMKQVLDNDTKQKFVRDFSKKGGKAKRQAWLDSQYAIINRSPVMTAGNMRALKFVGFAGGKDKKGFALITNSRNDMMLGGADKDIDSAHLSWGMPNAIKEGYKQNHVQFEFAKNLLKEDLTPEQQEIMAEGKKLYDKIMYLQQPTPSGVGKKGQLELFSPQEVGPGLSPAEKKLLEKTTKEYWKWLKKNEKKLPGKGDYDLKDDKFIEDTIGISVEKQDKTPFGIIHFGNKIKASEASTYGKDSLGIIDNGFTALKQIADFDLQKRTDLTQKEKLEIWQEIARLNAGIGNRFVDASEVVKIDSAFQYIEKTRDYLKKTYGMNTGKIETKFYNNFIKGLMKGKISNYGEMAEKLIRRQGDQKTIANLLADNIKDLNLKLDPLVGMEKQNLYGVLREVNNIISKDPYARAFGIENKQVYDNIIFNDALMTDQERQAILDNPHFLYNKMNPIRVLKAMEKTYDFLDNTHKGLKDKSIFEILNEFTGMSRGDMDSFVRELIHTAQYQKFMYSGASDAKLRKFKSGSKNDPERMSYAELVYQSKERLKSELDSYYSKKATSTVVPPKAKEIINKEVEKLFEYWHEANPVLHLNYNAMPKELGENVAKLEKRMMIVKGKILNVMKYRKGDKKKGEQVGTDMRKWDYDSVKIYDQLKKELGDLEYQLLRFQPEGKDNMARNSAISKEVKRDIYAYELKMIDAIKEPTPERMNSFLYDMVNLPSVEALKDVDGPGRIVENKILPLENGRFATQLVDWEKLSQAKNFKKAIEKELGVLDKQIEKKYGMPPKSLIKELDRFEDILSRMILHGNTAHVLDLSSIYLKAFERLNVVSGVEIDATTEAPLVDYNHLRIFSNILENRYMVGWKEWGARKIIHKKLVKELVELEKQYGEKLMPPEFDTDLMFPSELSKMFEKVEKVYKIGTAKVIKGGLMKDVGIRVPTTTVESIGQSIGRANTRGNTLKDAIENDLRAKLKLIEPDNWKEYTKIKDTIEGLAAYERQMGIVGDVSPANRGPREFEVQQSVDNLKNNVELYRKRLAKIDPDFRIRVKGIGRANTMDYTPREYVELYKDAVRDQMTESFELLHESNWIELEKIIGGKNFVLGNFKGGSFNFETFYRGEGVEPSKDIGSPEYKHRKLSELFLDKEGLVDPERVMFIETYNLNDRSLAEGKNVLKRHFHTEDITWLEFQLDIRDIVLEKYGTINKNGSIDLDYAKLNKIKSKKVKGTLLDEMRNFIRETNNDKLENSFIGFIGTEEVNGQRFSDTYHPLYHPKTKAYLEFVQDVHIPQETLRMYGQLYNTKSKETYRSFEEIDIEAFKRGEVVGQYKKNLGLKEDQLAQYSKDLYRDLERGFISMKDAVDSLYRNMVNKLINNPEQYSNDFYDAVTFDRLMNISTRSGSMETPGVGKFSTVRRRAPVPVEGYDITNDAYFRYIKTSSIGVTSQQAALISRLHINNFKNNILPGNKRIDPEVGRQWLHKIIDITKGYMNMPSNRSLALHGITEKEMKLLDDYAKSGYSMHFLTKQGDIITKKLINDFRMYTRPSDSEIRSIQNELYAKSPLKRAILDHNAAVKNIMREDFTFTNAEGKVVKPTQKQKDQGVKLRREELGKKKKQIAYQLRNKMYGLYKTEKGKLIPRNEISQIDYAENVIIKTNGDVVKYDVEASSHGLIRQRTLEYRDEFLYKTNADGKKVINKENIDITKIRKSFRGWYSEETVGNVFLRLEQKANKLLGHLTSGRVQIFKELPNDPAARHQAMINKLNWISDMEGKFEMMTLLSHPKSAIANLYGGTTNLISDVGFQFYMDTFNEKKLLEVFKNKTISVVDPITGARREEPIRTKSDVHTYFESFGFIESNIINELAYLRPKSDTNWHGFINEIAPAISESFKRLPIYTSSEKVNKENKAKRDKVIQETLTVSESATKYGIKRKFLELGALAMSSTERHLRVKTAMAHYMKARSLMQDSRGQVEVSEQFLLEYAQKGIEATQFIYHATNRPNFSNTAFGRIMTRFHPYSWNSIRRRANIITDRMLTEGYGDFDANKRFERQLSADLMVSALGTVFMASIFEYALSPPMSWAVDMSHLAFGDETQRERAFYNQYGHPLLSPLSIVTPPLGRFVLGPTTSLINNDWEAFSKYTAATALPFGRLGRDVLKAADTPEMWTEFVFGIPVHKFARLGKRPENKENTENEE